MILQHHERFDGSGYPNGLRGNETGLGSQILSVADVVEAMTHFRPYRPGLGLPVALDEIREGRGTRYAPDVVDSCLEIFASGLLDWTSDQFDGEAWYYNLP
jgi:HD-GYP domain-containing protein (c-di-GMP phosphodiesterase class II)